MDMQVFFVCKNELNEARGFMCAGMWPCVVEWGIPDILQERSPFIFKGQALTAYPATELHIQED